MTVWREFEAASATFIAIVPPADVIRAVRAVQTKHRVTDSFTPHITVKGQPGLAERRIWLPHVREALARIPAFEMALGPPEWFGKDLLVLTVTSRDVVQLHRAILAALERAGLSERWEYDGDGYNPHLTLGATFAGPKPTQLEALAADAVRLDLAPFTVESLWAFHRARPEAEYEPWTELTLSHRDLATDRPR